MIFVYPAIISETVDNKIVGPVTKVLEQYFLLHLQEAIQANSIRFVTDWQPGSQSYGPLRVMTENKKINSNQLLRESSSNYTSFDNLLDQEKSTVNKIIHKIDDVLIDKLLRQYTPEFLRTLGKTELTEAKRVFLEAFDKLSTFKTNLADSQNILNTIEDSVLKAEGDGEISQEERSDLVRTRRNITAQIRNREGEIDRWLNILKASLDLIKARMGERDPAEDRMKRKEYEEKIHGQYETHGMYKVEPMKGVSLKPTMANISVKIHHRGGPRPEGQQIVVGEMREIAIGTKILPLRMSNFESIEDAILDDYFTTKFQAMWRQYKRYFLRSALTKMQKWIGGLFDVRSSLNPVNANILLSNQGFVSGSSFEHKSQTSPIYQHSAAIVIFNKEDLMKEEGANFFLNRSQVNQMFKMGWNAFCILDRVKEEMLFISSVDGGHLHIIPYSYIYNTLGMDDVFKNINDLQKRSPIFRNFGNFSTLASKLKRESLLIRSVKHVLCG